MLSRFRREFHACLTARADELSELADAVLCAGGPVRSLAALSLAPEHRRGHGALYDAVNSGRIEIARLRRSLAGLPLPRAADGRLMLAADVSNWLRPGAATSPDRLFCHVYGRGKGQAQMIPGWPYSVVAALEPGRTSWTAVLDAVRLGPEDDEAEVARSKYDMLPGRPGATLSALAWALPVLAAPVVAAIALAAASGSIAPAVPNAARILTTRLRPRAERAIPTSAGPPGTRAGASSALSANPPGGFTVQGPLSRERAR